MNEDRAARDSAQARDRRAKPRQVSVKIREIAEALRCVKLDLVMTGAGGLSDYLHLSQPQAEFLAELAIRAMITPTEKMLEVGLDECPLFEDPNDAMTNAYVWEVWEAMCKEALR